MPVMLQSQLRAPLPLGSRAGSGRVTRTPRTVLTSAARASLARAAPHSPSPRFTHHTARTAGPLPAPMSVPATQGRRVLLAPARAADMSVPSPGDSETTTFVPMEAWTKLHHLLELGIGSMLLLAATAVSLTLANTTLGGAPYINFWETHMGPASLALHVSIKEWINEGLMALFFFAVGMEIKREFIFGSLSSLRQAILPCLGALGGMIVPMCICVAINLQPSGVLSAWAIPMATDIAFAMGVYNAFRHKMPPGVAAFLLTLATVDDLGAIAVIAVCFASNIVLPYLGAAAACCAGLAALAMKPLDAEKRISKATMAGITVLGVALWYCMLRGGINADVAGVVTAMAIPGAAMAPQGSTAPSEHGEGHPPTLLDHLIHAWTPFTALVVMPLFALANTCVALGGAGGGPAALLSTPVAMGIALGLLAGKPLGIAGLSVLGIKLGWAQWPTGMTVKHLMAVGLLGGIGFTMSLFLVEMSLTGASAAAGKLAILVASCAAAVLGATVLNTFPVLKADDIAKVKLP